MTQHTDTQEHTECRTYEYYYKSIMTHKNILTCITVSTNIYLTHNKSFIKIIICISHK